MNCTKRVKDELNISCFIFLRCFVCVFFFDGSVVPLCHPNASNSNRVLTDLRASASFGPSPTRLYGGARVPPRIGEQYLRDWLWRVDTTLWIRRAAIKATYAREQASTGGEVSNISVDSWKDLRLRGFRRVAHSSDRSSLEFLLCLECITSKQN